MPDWSARRREVILCGMMTMGIVINYLDRVNISHALPSIADEFELTREQQGLVLSAFSWGYVGLMLVGGILVDRIGAYRAAGLAAGAWSFATAATGVVFGPTALVASRVAVGAMGAPIFPANARLVRELVPAGRRGFAVALFDAGSYVGAAVSAPVVVALILFGGWRASFLLCAVVGVIWAVGWLALRGALVKVDRKRGVEASPRATMDFALLRERRIWGACAGFFAYNYSKNFYLTWMPVYLMQDRGLTLAQVGVLGALPPLSAVGGDLLGGLWTDRLVRRGHSLTLARKLPLLTGLLLGASIMLLPLVKSNGIAIVCLCAAFAANSSAAPAIWSLPGDFSRGGQRVGTIGGLQNTVANLAGVVAPIITGMILASTGSFSAALWIYGVVAVTGALACHLLLNVVLPVTE